MWNYIHTHPLFSLNDIGNGKCFVITGLIFLKKCGKEVHNKIYPMIAVGIESYSLRHSSSWVQLGQPCDVAKRLRSSTLLHLLFPFIFHSHISFYMRRRRCSLCHRRSWAQLCQPCDLAWRLTSSSPLYLLFPFSLNFLFIYEEHIPQEICLISFLVG